MGAKQNKCAVYYIWQYGTGIYNIVFSFQSSLVGTLVLHQMATRLER